MNHVTRESEDRMRKECVSRAKEGENSDLLSRIKREDRRGGDVSSEVI